MYPMPIRRLVIWLLFFALPLLTPAAVAQRVVERQANPAQRTAKIEQSKRSDRAASAARTALLTDEPVLLTHADSVRLFHKPDPLRAIWMGAIIPGYGQIYNRSYWKLPIVYAGFVGCAYAISYTGGRYNDYKTAYRDIYTDINAGTVTEDPEKSYIAILPEGYSLSYVGGANQWKSTLQSRQTEWRRYRDYSIVATIAVYALSLIDAYVDAQLFDFDISSDLSLHVEPAVYKDFHNQTTAELGLAIRF